MFPILVVVVAVDPEEVLDLLRNLVVGAVDLFIRRERDARKCPLLAQGGIGRTEELRHGSGDEGDDGDVARRTKLSTMVMMAMRAAVTLMENGNMCGHSQVSGP